MLDLTPDCNALKMSWATHRYHYVVLQVYGFSKRSLIPCDACSSLSPFSTKVVRFSTRHQGLSHFLVPQHEFIRLHEIYLF